MRHSLRLAAALPLVAIAHLPVRAQPLPDGFDIQTIVTGLDQPTAMAIAADGRIFVAQRCGMVRVIVGGVLRSAPFIDLSDEVQCAGQRGMLGLALDPSFLANHHVYLSFVVDPDFGPPEEPNWLDTFGRVVRYTGTVASNGNVADLASRLVLLGEGGADGVPELQAHSVDMLMFGADGSLLVAAGDGAHYAFADVGGNDPGCCNNSPLLPDQDIGAFRAQYLGSLAGKILRLDPLTGLGLPDNPYFTGDAVDLASRLWASGLRNPFRFCIRPGTGNAAEPGTIYIGDVGWNDFEELNIARGGENFGWPCREGFGPAPEYPRLMPTHAGCDTIDTPENPGPLTDPLMAWSLSDPDLSTPPGFTGSTAVGGVFYSGANYPELYRDAYFFADYGGGWIKVLRVDERDQLVSLQHLGDVLDGPVSFAINPASDDVYYISLFEGAVKQIRFIDGPGDLDHDGHVGAGDLAQLLSQWGRCSARPPEECAADLDRDNVVGPADLAQLLANWG